MNVLADSKHDSVNFFCRRPLARFPLLLWGELNNRLFEPSSRSLKSTGRLKNWATLRVDACETLAEFTGSRIGF
ncbi:MAG: hypothetical protein ABSH38_20680 [Verrucomicrobiota bacterium]|jgi:hypothetical protein